jgi:hypothetical protein
MRHTHGFQNQAAGPQVQAVASNIVPSTEPETPSRQPEEALLESQGNTKRRRGFVYRVMMPQMTKLKEAGVPAGRKGGGSVWMWKSS